MYHNLFTHSSADETLGLLPFWDFMDNAAMNMHTRLCEDIIFFFPLCNYLGLGVKDHLGLALVCPLQNLYWN